MHEFRLKHKCCRNAAHDLVGTQFSMRFHKKLYRVQNCGPKTALSGIAGIPILCCAQVRDFSEQEQFFNLKNLFKKNDSFTNVTSLRYIETTFYFFINVVE